MRTNVDLKTPSPSLYTGRFPFIARVPIVWCAGLDCAMSLTTSLRCLIKQALRQHPDPHQAAQAIAEAIVNVTRGSVRPRKGWIGAMLLPMIDGVLDRAMGCMDYAALALSRDLALVNPFNLVENGWFGNDDRVLDWHREQVDKGRSLPH